MVFKGSQLPSNSVQAVPISWQGSRSERRNPLYPLSRLGFSGGPFVGYIRWCCL